MGTALSALVRAIHLIPENTYHVFPPVTPGRSLAHPKTSRKKQSWLLDTRVRCNLCRIRRSDADRRVGRTRECLENSRPTSCGAAGWTTFQSSYHLSNTCLFSGLSRMGVDTTALRSASLFSRATFCQRAHWPRSSRYSNGRVGEAPVGRVESDPRGYRFLDELALQGSGKALCHLSLRNGAGHGDRLALLWNPFG